MPRPNQPSVLWTSKDGHCRIITHRQTVKLDEAPWEDEHVEVIVEEITGQAYLGEPVWRRTGRHTTVDDPLPNHYLREFLSQYTAVDLD